MSGISVESSSEVTAERDEYLTAAAVAKWIDKLPPGATIQAITKDIGSQRDPYIVTIGLRAKWSEVRHDRP